MLGLQVESDNWVMEAEMLNQAQGMFSDLWWNVSPVDRSEYEGMKAVTLVEALQASIDYHKPKHQHDCTECVALGHFMGEGEVYDLYFCKKSNPTVIARFGPEGDYYSGLALADKIRPLGAAKERALILGYLHTCPYKEDIEGDTTTLCTCDNEDVKECMSAI